MSVQNNTSILPVCPPREDDPSVPALRPHDGAVTSEVAAREPSEGTACPHSYQVHVVPGQNV